MKRSFIFIGLTVAALALLTLISATLAAPQNAPSLQDVSEDEPNDSPSEANPINVNIQVSGNITQTALGVEPVVLDTDYFALDTQAGIRYVADLTILSDPAMELQLRVFDDNMPSPGLLGVSTSSDTSVQLTWDATGGTNYIQVRKSDAPSITFQTEYQLEIALWSAPATPEPPDPWDDYEPNDTFGTAYQLPVNVSVQLSTVDGKANFAPFNTDPDVDWYSFYVLDGQRYEAFTSDLSNADTTLALFRQTNSSTPIDTDDNSGAGFGSRIEWTAAYDGYYYIRVTNNTPTEGSYDLTVQEAGAGTPTPTGTPTATRTPLPGADAQADGCENNFDLENACIIGADDPQTFNFVPPYGGVDNDFFRLWVKPNLIYECQTSNLDPGIDPNMIVYDHNRNALGGNDDIEPGNLNSRFAYYSSYEGWLYVLVGYGNRTPPDIYNSDYTLECTLSVPGQPSPTPTNTPRPGETATPTPTSSGSALPTPPGGGTGNGLTVRPMSTPTPRPTPEAPSLHFVPVNMIVYYDANNDNESGAGEGVAGVLVLAYDTATGEEIAQGFTDELGHLEFTAAAEGLVRLRIPYLGISYVIGEESDTVYVRIAPHSASTAP
jgi:hypothetical protein